ncbi:DUF4442 domain-containing protein [Mangrovactinospora gilvigrisea]|uniref:DUF4442 domain-containing protein n=1 Tax=Mangrovactinospora gilvigrisea TaxID=1428644 RepID=A0A1J7BHQ2_9ACTN|nr:DUF4442 domain-containing protein [Mangrovactinospora gilvigrisea]OIV38182.1 DUF4442 domain-containing protein [Mangrovactinospora gilvigrisea]
MATTDDHTIDHPLRQAVPFVRTLGLEFLEASAERAVLRLPDVPEQRNHIGGPHAGAMWTLAEAASGTITLEAFGHRLGDLLPLPVHSEIQFLKPAMGRITATAVLGRPADEVIAESDGGTRPEFPVKIDLTTEDGTVTGRMSITWTLKRVRA